MAYTSTQENDIAFELARAGCNVRAAVAALRAGYESFNIIGESTLRRLLKRDDFQDLVATKAAVVKDANDRACAVAAERRALQQMEGSVFGQLREDDALLAKARKRLEEVLLDPNADQRVLADAFKTLSSANERRRDKAVPVVTTTQEVSVLLIIIAEEIRATVGNVKAGKCMLRIQERYNAELANRATSEATDTPETAVNENGA